ncbi:PAS domain-containing protein, partial [Leptospira sp. SA-E8]|uniref:PAS domain-containing protein n=1 Tax=Leptospira sp. SA-E8 TaxID=3422259 RepID=UPI003EC09C27
MRHRTSLMRYAVIFAGVVFTLVFAASSAYDALYQRDQIYEASERELGNFSKVLASETARSIQTVNILLRDTAWWYQRQGRSLPPGEVDRTLKIFSDPVSQIALLALTDENGFQRWRSKPLGVSVINVGDRPYYRVHRENDEVGLYINVPIFSRSLGKKGLVMSRRLADDRGGFGGVVTATVRLDHLRNTYDGIDFGSQTEMHVAFLDGTPVISLPQLGDDDPLPRPELAEVELGEHESVHARQVIEGRRKVVAAARVPGQPMIVYLVRDETEILRGWYTETRHMLVRTLILAVCVLVSVWLAIRQLKMLDRHEQALSQSEQRYALAMDAANEGHAEWDFARDLVYLSPRWREMHFLPQNIEITLAEFREMARVHPDDRGLLSASMEQHLLAQVPFFEAEYRVQPFRDGQGPWHWIYARGRVHRDAAGQPARFYWTTTDISHRRAAESEKVQLEAKLLRARHLESLGTMA